MVKYKMKNDLTPYTRIGMGFSFNPYLDIS